MRLHKISMKYSLNIRLTEICLQHATTRILRLRDRVSRAIWQHVWEVISSRYNIRGRRSPPERLELDRISLFIVILVTTKKSWWSRKKFSPLRIFRVHSAARCWLKTRRRLVQDSSTTRSKESRVRNLPSRRAFNFRMCCGAAVCCVGVPCAPFDGTGRRTHACCDEVCDLTHDTLSILYYVRSHLIFACRGDDTLRFAAKLGRSASSRLARSLAEISSGLTYKGLILRREDLSRLHVSTKFVPSHCFRSKRNIYRDWWKLESCEHIFHFILIVCDQTCISTLDFRMLCFFLYFFFVT